MTWILFCKKRWTVSKQSVASMYCIFWYDGEGEEEYNKNNNRKTTRNIETVGISTSRSEWNIRKWNWTNRGIRCVFTGSIRYEKTTKKNYLSILHQLEFMYIKFMIYEKLLLFRPSLVLNRNCNLFDDLTHSYNVLLEWNLFSPVRCTEGY